MPKQHEGKQAESPKKSRPEFIIKRFTEGSFILVLTSALFILLSLLSYELSDPGWSHASYSSGEIINLGGQVGAYLADALYFMLGYFAYLLPFTLVYLAWLVIKDFHSLRTIDRAGLLLRSVGLILMISGAVAY